MQNTEVANNNCLALKCHLIITILEKIKYKAALTACITTGIILGCVTQALYGDSRLWANYVEAYCVGFRTAMISVFPITLGFISLLFIFAPFRLTRPFIYPATAFRGLGIGALICGAVQYGRLRELCFATLVLIPYAAFTCTIAVYSGEYSLGLRESFSRQNEGLTGNLYLHAVKMFMFYLTASALSCIFFSMSCYLFGKYLMS